jgi:hypothetical protein
VKAVAIALLWTLLASNAFAEPGFARMFRGKYGYEPACHACHTEGGGSELTAYGADFKKAGKSVAALSAIEPLDSDHDGFANLAEIKAKANPGSRSSTPDKPGDWLDPSRLIPAEVQKIFPGVHTYKPLDAVFTAAEIARAKALGVSLSEADETTIYVPFEGGQAQGAAVIVPTLYDGKPLFLVVAADRALSLRAVAPIAAKGAPRGVKIDPSFIGKRVNQVEVPQGLAPADMAVATGVKKAATMLYVRLTKGVEK